MYTYINSDTKHHITTLKHIYICIYSYNIYILMYQERHLLAHHSPNAKGMCICIRIHTYIYNICMNIYDIWCIYVQQYITMYAFEYTRKDIQFFITLPIQTQAHIHIHLQEHIYICAYPDICICTYMYVCIRIPTNTTYI